MYIPLTSLSAKWWSMRSPGTISSQHQHFLMGAPAYTLLSASAKMKFATQKPFYTTTYLHIENRCLHIQIMIPTVISIFNWRFGTSCSGLYFPSTICGYTTALSQAGASVWSKIQSSVPSYTIYECNAARRSTKHKGSIHGKNNTLVLPPSSFASAYWSPQPKSKPQYCAPLVDLCISHRCSL